MATKLWDRAGEEWGRWDAANAEGDSDSADKAMEAYEGWSVAAMRADEIVFRKSAGGASARSGVCVCTARVVRGVHAKVSPLGTAQGADR